MRTRDADEPARGITLLWLAAAVLAAALALLRTRPAAWLAVTAMALLLALPAA